MKKLYVTVLALFCCFLVHTSSSAQKTVTELTEKWDKSWYKENLAIYRYDKKELPVESNFFYYRKDSLYLIRGVDFLYTADGQLKEQIWKRRVRKTDAWIDAGRYQNFFRPKEKQPYMSESYHGDEYGDCLLRSYYEYNKSGQISAVRYENECEFSRFTLVGISCDMVYNAEGRVQQQLETYGINRDYSFRKTFVYGKNGKVLTEFEDVVYNNIDPYQMGMMEIPSTRTDYIYDEEGREVEGLKKEWREEDEDWIEVWRKKNTYNGDGTLAESLSQLLEKGKWVNELRKTYTYTEENESETVQTGNARPQLQVFPVPASDKLCVELPQELPATYRLLNIQGMELQSATLSPGSPAIDVHALAPGLYLLYLRQAENEYSIRFVKQ
ncbi:MAG: T9SS type A sorting domain-containing protein [Flavobacteriales bacterium]